MIKDKFYLISPASLLVSEAEKGVIYVRVTGLYNSRVIRSQLLQSYRVTELWARGLQGLQGYTTPGITGLYNSRVIRSQPLQSYRVMDAWVTGITGLYNSRVIRSQPLQSYRVMDAWVTGITGFRNITL